MIQPWYHYWYGWQARVSAIWHWIRGHDLHWRKGGIDEFSDMGLVTWRCDGDIVCENCPDCMSGTTGIVFWCRGREV
jgi:hypothetical protein